MATSSQCSSMLLLILIGLSLYLLLNTSENFRTKKREFFDSIMGSVAPISNADPMGIAAPMGTAAPINNSGSLINSAPINNVVPVVPIVNSNYIDNTSHEVNLEPQPSSSVINYDIQENTIPQIDTRPIPQGSFNPLISFVPNDDSIFDDNAPLNIAFNSPLAPGSNADVIDFKKGNVDNYNAKDFLPREINDEWFETDFSLAKYQLNDDKLINTDRYVIGINTIGSSLKNASKDIRGTISNPKFTVSPWNNSSYEPDFNLKPLC